MPVRKIVITGPESTGKSTLCRQLAAHYNTRWVDEYAREYLHQHGKHYQYEDLYKIACGQVQAEEAALSDPQLLAEHLFIDTDLYVIKTWSEFVYGKCDNRILTTIAERTYDLYLLCNTDLPWEYDELREYPDIESRQRLLNYYKDALVNQHVPWVMVSGTEAERLQQACTAIEKYFPVI
jgi:NadR type nicotinamide-nucleotide adenylyltransferase